MGDTSGKVTFLYLRDTGLVGEESRNAQAPQMPQDIEGDWTTNDNLCQKHTGTPGSPVIQTMSSKIGIGLTEDVTTSFFEGRLDTWDLSWSEDCLLSELPRLIEKRKLVGPDRHMAIH